MIDDPTGGFFDFVNLPDAASIPAGFPFKKR